MIQKNLLVLEYSHLIEKANEEEDKCLQCIYILACFSIVFSNSVGHTLKPFAPLLGETYEIFDEKTNSKFIIE